MKKSILSMLLAFCMSATLTVFPTYADGELIINGDDIVCAQQDYRFSFVLPEGYTNPSAGYEFEMVGSDADLVEKDGVCTGIVKASWYDKNDDSFEVIVHAMDRNGNDVSARKTVALSAAHTGEPAWSITPNLHEKLWSCCGTVIIARDSHEFVNGICTVCDTPDINTECKFSDVTRGSYYYDAVLWAVKSNVTIGTSDNTFEPDTICTRAQIVTFLWRAAGEPSVNTQIAFLDVNHDEYYYKAVQWAVSKGIVKGTSETTFEPEAACTRAQVVTFLWRANGSPAVSGTGFLDVPADEYFTSAVQWAVANGITNGVDDNHFEPMSACTRGQAVTFLLRGQNSK